MGIVCHTVFALQLCLITPGKATLLQPGHSQLKLSQHHYKSLFSRFEDLFGEREKGETHMSVLYLRMAVIICCLNGNNCNH